MAKLGFLFEINSSKEQFLVFVNHEKTKNDTIVGASRINILENLRVYFLTKTLELKNYSIINWSFIRRAKFHVSKNTVLDYEYNTFWFNSIEYRELRQLFEIEEFSKKIIISKVIDIVEYFR